MMRLGRTTTILGVSLLLVSMGLVAAEELDIGPYGETYSDTTRTRGYWFVAPLDFTITGLRVPTDVGPGPQNIEVLRLNVTPPGWPSDTTDFTSLGYWRDVDSADFIATNIPVAAGDIIGVLGARGTSTMNNSYAQANTYATSIGGQPVTIKRFLTQYNLYNTQAVSVSTEEVLAYSRVEMQYVVDTTAPAVTASADRQTLWPPNHKSVTVTISGTVEDDSAIVDVFLHVDDEYDELDGTYTVTLAGDGSFVVPVELVAWRNGKDRDGRTYVITVCATDEWGNFGCSGPVTVLVPHDQRK
jgi:hypothetical protein